MLHTKPQGHWPFGSGEEDFWRVFTIYGSGGHLGHVTQIPRINFRSPIPLRLPMKFCFDRPSGYGEKDLWKWWTTDGRTDDGRTDNGPWLYYRLTDEPKGSGELKKRQMCWSITWEPERKPSGQLFHHAGLGNMCNLVVWPKYQQGRKWHATQAPPWNGQKGIAQTHSWFWCQK